MKLGQKLFLSHVLVAAIGMVIFGIVTLPVASYRFVVEQEEVELNTRSVGQSEVITTQVVQNEAPSLHTNFVTAIAAGFVVAGIVAVVAAGGISWLVTQRMLRPIQNIAAASHTIAEGHYDLTIPVQQRDELGELAGHFNTMAAALNSIETSRKQLLADVSHELNTPLASIRGYMEGLQEGVIAASPQTFRLVYQETIRLQRLVHDLHTLSEGDLGMVELRPIPLKLTDLIKTVREHLTLQFENKGVILELHMPTQSALLWADRDRLTQVLMNIMGNALQYTPAGGKVTVTMSESSDELELTISDTGIGISAEHLPHIFQRFYRVDQSRARASGGSGIGLTIARQYIEAHGGCIQAESAGVGHGSRFLIILPKLKENFIIPQS